MSTSTNYGFVKPELNQSADITVVSDAIEAIDNTIKSVENKNLVQIATGTANAIALTLGTLVNGYQVTFIASANNNASATTINGKSVFKPSTTNSPTFIKDKGYKVYYNSSNDCFFCLASAEGTALASQVLKDATYSTEVDTGLKGIMPNNGELSSTLNCGTSFTIPLGYTSGGTITASSLASQTVASATANQILYGITAWINGVKVTGSMPNLTGTRNATGVAKWGDGGLAVYPERGYQKGGSGDGEIKVSVSQMQSVNPYLQAPYIVNGCDIFGIIGSATIESLGGAKYVTGSILPPVYSYTLSFTPKIVIINQGGRLYIVLNGAFGFPKTVLMDIRSTFDRTLIFFGDINSYLNGNTIIMWADQFWAFG